MSNAPFKLHKNSTCVSGSDASYYEVSHEQILTIRDHPIRAHPRPQIGPCQKVLKIMVFGGFWCFLVLFRVRPEEAKSMSYCAGYSVPFFQK